MLSIAYRNITPISTTNTNSQTMAASITEAHLACLSTVIQVNRYIRFLSQPFDCSSYRWSILSINRFYSFQLVYCTSTSTSTHVQVQVHTWLIHVIDNFVQSSVDSGLLGSFTLSHHQCPVHSPDTENTQRVHSHCSISRFPHTDWNIAFVFIFIEYLQFPCDSLRKLALYLLRLCLERVAWAAVWVADIQTHSLSHIHTLCKVCIRVYHA